MRCLFAVLAMLISMAAASASETKFFKIPWKGDYGHNSSRTWSRDNPYDSGFSKNFLNGAPEEDGKVQKDGELWVETSVPENTTGPIPFMIVMHGCAGLNDSTNAWAHRVAESLNAQGIGALILDSYTTRKVKHSCGMPDFHWGRRRADDAYSALDYLIESGRSNEVYLTGQSNGGLATLIAMSKEQSDHKNKFAAGFPIVPSCINTPVKYGDYVRPMIIFIGEKDDANPPQYCRELMKKKRAVPIQLIEYQNANHGFMTDAKDRTIKGWTDNKGKEHWWVLSYNPVANKDMMQTIISAIKTKTFKKGVEYR